MSDINKIIHQLKTDQLFKIADTGLSKDQRFEVIIGITEGSIGSSNRSVMYRAFALWKDFNLSDWKNYLTIFKNNEWALANILSLTYSVLKIDSIVLILEIEPSFKDSKLYQSYLSKAGLFALYPNDIRQMRTYKLTQEDIAPITADLISQGALPADPIEPSYLKIE